MWIRFLACAAESADSTSDCTRDSEWWAAFLGRSATWRGNHSHARVWAKRLKKGGWMKHLSGAVICDSCPWTSYPESTTSPADILASLLAPLVSDRASKTRDTCGRGCSSASRLSDLEESSLRTSQGTSRWGCSTSCPTWKAAVTERRGAATRRRLSALRTDASESSSSGWPTPDCTMRPHEGNVRLLRKGVEQGMDKAEADAMLGRDIGKPQGKLAAWPTPRASTGGADPHSRKTGKNLQHAVNWPTPMTRDHKDGTATYDVPTNGHLGRAAPRDPTSHPGQLNPNWVEMLMGFPIGWTDCAPSETQ